MDLDRSSLLTVARSLEQAAIPFALGGSGLLHAYGLTTQVRDWDLTTDAPLDQVQLALAHLPCERAENGDGIYATGYKLTVRTDGPEVEVIGQFTIRTETGLCRLPTLVSKCWGGVPVGSPAVWAAAYRLMGRHPKADLLSQHLALHSDDAVVQLLEQPLPPPLRQEVMGWAKERR